MPDSISITLGVLRWGVWLLGGTGLVATLLPLLRQTAWWIRVCDFCGRTISARPPIVAATTASFVLASARRSALHS